MNENEFDSAFSICKNLSGSEFDGLRSSAKIETIEIPLRKYMQYNNFTVFQMKHIFFLLNEFCRLSKLNIHNATKELEEK